MIKKKNKIPIKKFITAAGQGNLGVIKEYIKHGGDPNARLKNGEDAFYIAITMKQQAVVNLLLEEGFDVLSVIYDGSTALHEAAFSGSVSVIESILKKGITVNQKIDCPESNTHGRTPLMNACVGVDGDSKASVKLLLEYDADPNIQDIKGETALTLTLKSIKTRRAILLSSRRKDTNWNPDHASETMIEIYKQSENEVLEIIELLTLKGALTTLKNSQEESAFSISQQYGLRKIIDFLSLL